MVDIEEIRKIYSLLGDEESKEIYRERISYSFTGDIRALRSMIDKELDYVRRNKDFKALMEVIKGARPRYIFGAGDYCARIHALAPEIEWDGILDNDIEKRERRADIFPPSYIKGKDAYIVIPSFEYYDEMVSELEALGVSPNHIIDARIIYHLTDGQQYFDLEYLDYSAMKTFIDGGSYNGQTAIRFSEMSNQVGKVYCFEADKKNITRLDERLSELRAFPYEIIPKGIWDKDSTLHFYESGTGSSYIIEDEDISGDAKDSIEVTAIDNLVEDDIIDMIKFDIEGSELKGLLGCEDVIKRCHPVLAICVYHKPEDIYEIPSAILRMDDSYKLYLRHYSFGPNETVLYAT